MRNKDSFCRCVPEGVWINIPGTFDLKQIADSGQCFRLTPLQGGGYAAVTREYLVKIAPHKEGGCIFHCSPEDFQDVWVPYFDLEADYSAYQEKMSGDPFLRKAIVGGGGIRILQQDLWEMVVTFTISQRNNIPRIRKAVDTLCRLYGTKLGEIDGQDFYSFPTPGQLKGQNLSPVSLGYRERYVSELARQDPMTWLKIQGMNDEYAKKTLTDMNGIGEKVANCVMLFGLHRMNSYPKDVWINRMIEDIYDGEFDPKQYAGFAGYVQQLQFFYYRQMAKDEAVLSGAALLM